LGEGYFRTLNWQPGQPISQFETVVQSQSFTMPQQALTAEGWQFADTTALNLLEKLRNAGTPLGEYVNNRFYRGIVTGLNEAFVVDRATRDRLIAEHPSSAEVLKPFLRGRDVKRWTVNYQDLWLIFTRRGIDIKKYPAIEKHLRQFKKQLEKKAGGNKWYELQASPADTDRFEKPKIIYQEIATYQAFAWDDTGCYSNNKTFLIPDASLYLLALLNSKVVWFFLNHTVQKMAGGTFALQTIYMENIPIPPASPADRASIETLVQQCLDAQGKDVAPYEAEIDDIVARLYGLTEAERAIIAGREG
jgi:adenine-specific DNA-methyltransferase